MIRQSTAATIACFAAAIATTTISAQNTSPAFGSLATGKYSVGFTKKLLRDPTRPTLPKLDARGNPETRDRARQLVIHVWYPAAASSKRAMTVADYLTSAFADSVSDSDRRADEANRRQFISQFGPVTDSSWNALKATLLIARRDAGSANGKFPLVVGQLREFSTTITNEYLASHGYVIAMIDGPNVDIRDPGAGLDIAVRDMELAVPEMRKLPFVDPVKLAALGFSGSGFSQILFAMRHPDVDAVSDLESAIFDERVFWPLSRGWGFDVRAMRVPFLHTYSVPLSRLENRFSDFEAMRYSQRYHYLVDAPGIHHWDFATEGMLASTVLGNRGANGLRLRQAFETTNRYLLAFFNAYVKGDQTELAFLRRDPAANGAPSGLATIRELPAIRPAPSAEQLDQLIRTQGLAAAMTVFATAQRDDPTALLFEEQTLNSLGYRLFRNGKQPEGIAIFRENVRLHPASSNVYDSLAEALEAVGNRAEAIDASRKGLEVLEREGLPSDRRAQIKQIFDDRLKRLAP